MPTLGRQTDPETDPARTHKDAKELYQEPYDVTAIRLMIRLLRIPIFTTCQGGLE